MELLLGISNFLKTYLFDQPGFLIGIVAFVGLLIQKKGISEVISGSVKSVIGFLIVSTAAGIIAGAVFPIADILNKIIGIEVSTAGAIGQEGFINQWGSEITIIMTGSFFVNILIARFTKAKFVYLTVHQMFWMIFVYLAAFLEVVPVPNIPMLLVLGSILGGIYFTLQPAITQPFLRKVTGNDNFAYGHTTSFGVIVASIVGNVFKGKKEQTSEDIKIPEKLSFLKEITVSTALIMTLLYTIGVLLAGNTYIVENISEGQAPISWAINQGLTVSLGITVLLVGVNMMIAEIVPAFRGISQKIVPNAIPALDCPVVFSFAPTAVMLGFVSTLSTVIICTLIFGVTGFYSLTPPVITTFFAGGPAGVFGNSTGGWRGAVLGGIVVGLLISFGQALTVGALSTTVADFARWSNDLDYAVFPYFFRKIIEFLAMIFHF